MTARPPTLSDVLDARRAIKAHLRPTPLHRYPLLDRLVGAEAYVKHENHLPIGAFKVRGGINLISRLTASEREAGVLAASTGNHGQSIAYAARLFGVPATIYVPCGANPIKLAAIRAWGAEVIEHGADFDEARVQCAAQAAERRARYVDHGNEPLLVAGVATAAFEILEDQPAVDTIIVPVGGGSGAAAACIVVEGLRPGAEVIAVQSSAAPAAQRSWKARELREDGMHTFAEGLATRTACELTQQILWDRLDDFVLVSDDELRAATLQMIQLTRNLVEPSGAAPLAAALRLREHLAGRCVALVCSGGNISPGQLAELLAWGRRTDSLAVAEG